MRLTLQVSLGTLDYQSFGSLQVHIHNPHSYRNIERDNRYIHLWQDIRKSVLHRSNMLRHILESCSNNTQEVT